MKQLSGVRKAVAGVDDATFSRFVRVQRGSDKPPHKTPLAPADATGTRFPKRVLPPSRMTRILVSGHSNIKIGRDVRIGKLKGYWIYTLSLEERATCPRSCHHWRSCYGNASPLAKRVDHTAPDFLPRLEAEIADLCSPRSKGVRRKGVIIRLHALGDFYSPEYVSFWDRMLRKHADLVIFGYTAWGSGTLIGHTINELINAWPGRAMIRFSNGGMRSRSTVPIVRAEDCPPGAFVCPEQTGQFEACGKCGACWATLKNVAFIEH